MESFSYSNPFRVCYPLGSLNFDSAQVSYLINPPYRCKQGRVAEMHVRATVTFAGATTLPNLMVGTVATPAKYAQMNINAAANASQNIASSLPSKAGDDTAVVLLDINLDRDAVTQIQIQANPGTGTGHAGTGLAEVTIAWF